MLSPSENLAPPSLMPSVAPPYDRTNLHTNAADRSSNAKRTTNAIRGIAGTSFPGEAYRNRTASDDVAKPMLIGVVVLSIAVTGLTKVINSGL